MTTSAGQHQTNPNEVSTYSYDQTYDTIHNITRKNQVHQFKNSTQPDTTYDYTFTYPASGSARPHGAVSIGPYDILHDANGNLTRQTRVGTSDIVHYVYDEENRLACVHKGAQVPPNPSCNEQGVAPLEFIYDHAGVRKRKDASSPTFYPNQFLTDIGGGAGGQFKHIFLGLTRILTMTVIPPPDKQQWYYHADHLGSTSIVSNEKGQLAEHTHYFPYGEVWLQERPSTPVPYLFSSKEFDPETGLYDFGSRYLNPRLALWMTTDPALGDYLSGKGIQTPPNLALYGYSFNNPATFWDPDGAEPQYCTPDNPRGDPPPPTVFVSAHHPRAAADNRWGNSMGIWFLGPPLGGFPALIDLLGGSEKSVEAAGQASFGLLGARGASRGSAEATMAAARRGPRQSFPSGAQDGSGRPLSSSQYSVWFELKLRRGTYTRSDEHHIQQANRGLHREFQRSPDFAAAMESAYPGITAHVAPGPQGAHSRDRFPGLSWHHHPLPRRGILQGVPTPQHRAPGPVQSCSILKGRVDASIGAGAAEEDRIEKLMSIEIGQFKPLREVLQELADAKEEEIVGWLFLPRGEQWTLQTRAILLRLEDVPPEMEDVEDASIPELAKKEKLQLVLQALDVKDVIINAQLQKPDIGLDGIFSAFLYYVDHDAFKDLFSSNDN